MPFHLILKISKLFQTRLHEMCGDLSQTREFYQQQKLEAMRKMVTQSETRGAVTSSQTQAAQNYSAIGTNQEENMWNAQLQLQQYYMMRQQQMMVGKTCMS